MDGDILSLFPSDDADGELMYCHCMTSVPKMVKKVEDFSQVTNIAHKKSLSRVVSLTSSTWLPEKEVTILQEFEEKGIIGRMWYCLMHYMYLTAHYIPEDKDKNLILNRRLNLMIQHVEDNSDIDIGLVLPKFLAMVKDNTCVNNNLEELDTQGLFEHETLWVEFSALSEDQMSFWHHLVYVSIAHTCFPIYEVIFDLRKGDGRPPFDPTEVISGLMGYKDKVDWTGLEQGGVWCPLIKSVWQDFPLTEEGGIDILSTVIKFPVFYHLLSQRRLLSAANRFQSTTALIDHMNVLDFAEFLSKQLMQGV